jgi:hypothetical protein
VSTPLIETAFVSGELSPGLFGSVDLAHWHTAAATLRNCFVSYRRGAFSRAGTAFVGFSKQTGSANKPRLIPFQFNIQQGLVLEFGNQYMRVISEGGYVTDIQGTVLSVSNANPIVLTATFSAIGAVSAVPIDSGVTSSYSPSDLVTLAGGTSTVPAQLQVLTTQLLKLSSSGGQGYVPGDTINPAGGTQTTQSQVSVTSTQVSAVAFHATGSMSALGFYTMQGTTGTGTRFTVLIQVTAGPALTFFGITNAGAYTVNPTNVVAEPMVVVSGPGTWTGLQLSITMGPLTLTVTNPGVFTANPPSNQMTQGSTSGGGTGATFPAALMGPLSVRIANAGVYSSFPSNPVAQASTNGTGAGATFTLTTGAVPGGLPPQNGDWLFFAGVGGTTQLNGQTLIAVNVSGNSFSLTDVYGNPINSTAWGVFTSGGMVSRIYTLTTPYAAADLDWLKWTQSADVMSLTCVNQQTLTEYPPQDLNRLADDNWIFTPVVPAPSVLPPGQPGVAASAAGSIDYQYEVTAVSPADGTESIASPIGSLAGGVDIAATAGTITIAWPASPTPGVSLYNIYKAAPGFGSMPPAGALFGFAGQAYGNVFLDSNIIPDFTQVPPTNQNPFARGSIGGVNVTSSAGTVTSAVVTINTSTGSGAQLSPVIVGSTLFAILVVEGGQNYSPNDTITVSVTGGGSATATLILGPQSGTYPGCVAYFQQRRAYGFTLNQPDTYFMSQTGAFTNFDFRVPTIDSDAITGSPWSEQVNGIQFMLNLPQGLLVLTGLSVWLLVGAGSYATNVVPISPSSQDANPQPELGSSPTVPPIKIDYDVLYVSARSTIYFDLPYQLYTLSTPLDVTQLSSHLFTGYSIREHAWCREPNKLLWAVRNDGVMLSLTWLKPEQVCGWARHDTNGLFVSVCSVIEPSAEIATIPGQPTPGLDALYVVTQRLFGANTAYVIERMDDRIWKSVEDCWCVDCGFTLPLPQPNATLFASSATGLGAVTGVTGLVGGNGYSAGTTAAVVDAPLSQFGPLGPGTGAVPTLTIVGGVITAITFSGGNQGSNYRNPQLVITDPAGSAGGSGASATCVLSNTMTFGASVAVFSAGDVGSVIRMGGGIAAITAFIDSQHVTGNMLSPIVDVVPNTVVPGSGGLVKAQPAGSWSKAAPVSSIYIPQLAGAAVTGLADGNVIPAAVVPANGVLNLPVPATRVTVGLGFQVQLQSLYIDAGSPTVQGQRKKVSEATARIEASAGFNMGSNQPDGSTLSPRQIAPLWTNLDSVPNLAPKPYNALAQPLFTGDVRVPIQGGFQKPGQVALEQDLPLPMQVLALVPEVNSGDLAEQKAQPRQKGKAA